jgi:ribosomal protein S27E
MGHINLEALKMSRNFKSPIRCPNCHEKLTIIEIQNTRIFEWTSGDEDDGEGRFEDNGQGSQEILCYNCGSVIGHYDANDKWGLFPDDCVVDF